MTVSVCMITYNHQNYLEQAINSVLMQKTTFDYELIIANDNSLDETDVIIKKCILLHPNGNKIKYIHNTSNIGMMPNFINALQQCSGKYIAMCEGDDYWTDKNKLQKQVDFLEENQEFCICYHQVDLEIDGKIQDDKITSNVPQITDIKKLALENYIHTCSVVYRNNMFQEFPDYFINAPVGDYFLHMLNARFGKIYCIKEKMAIYRVHNTSYWSSKEQIDRENIWIDFLENIKSNFDKDIQKILSKQIYKLKKRRLKGIKKLLYKIEYFFN